MIWKPAAILVLGVFLGAAAAPPSDCPGASGATTLPLPMDLQGRPLARSGLNNQNFAALPSTEAAAGCRTPLPSASTSSNLRSEQGDVLHSLPAPDILRPIDEPRHAPVYR
jgi:hypothetical protein